MLAQARTRRNVSRISSDKPKHPNAERRLLQTWKTNCLLLILDCGWISWKMVVGSRWGTVFLACSQVLSSFFVSFYCYFGSPILPWLTLPTTKYPATFIVFLRARKLGQIAHRPSYEMGGEKRLPICSTLLTPSKINMLPLKRDHLKRKVVFQHFSKGHVSFPGEGCTVATLRYGLHPEVHLATGRRSRCANHLQPATRSPLSTCWTPLGSMLLPLASIWKNVLQLYTLTQYSSIYGTWT